MSTAERSAALVLTLTPLACGLAALLMMLQHGAYDQTRRHDVLLLVAAAGLFHALPSFLLHRAFSHRRSRSDVDWTPQESTPGGRGWAITGALAVTGAWTALLGSTPVTVFLVIVGPSGGVDDADVLATMAAVLYPAGMLLGLLCAVFIVPIARQTRMDVTVPRLVWIPIAVGTMAATAFPLLGLITVPVTMLVVSLGVRAKHPIFLEGCCQSCGYDLSGSTSRRCPECGVEAAITPEVTASGAHAEPRT